MADTIVVEGDSQTTFLREEASSSETRPQLQADSIRYHEASCRLDAEGHPQLFEQGTVLVGEGMRYDTCVRRGTVRDALTDFQQVERRGTSTEISRPIRGTSGVYVASANFTSDPQPCRTITSRPAR